MTLAGQVNALATRIGTEVKSLWTAVNGKAASSHTHVATTDLTATGTKNSTTFLRGDDTWAAPPGGGGGSSGSEFDLTQDWTPGTQPTTPSAGSVLFTRHDSRRMLSVIGPSGQDFTAQPSLFSNRVARWNAVANSGTPTVDGLIGTNGSAPSGKVINNTNFFSFMVAARYAISSTAGSGNQMRTNAQWFHSSTAGLGGFFWVCRVGLNATTATSRTFFGLSTTATALSATVDPTTLLSLVGFANNSADTNFKFISNDATGTATVVDLGANFPCKTNAVDFYEFRMFCPSGGGQNVYWSAKRLNTGHFVQGQVTTDLPALNTPMASHCHMSNGTTAAIASFDLQSLYVESDN